MSSNFLVIFILIISCGYLASVIGDIVLYATWNKTFFTSGLLIFVTRVPVNNLNIIIPTSSLLEAEYRSGVSVPLVFKEINNHMFGFREKLFAPGYLRSSSLMHGLLIFDKANSEVVVKGFANWDLLGLILILIFGLIFYYNEPILMIGLICFIILISGMHYFKQKRRFSSVATYAAQLWSRKS